MTHSQAGPAISASSLYEAAQQVDEWPGSDYDGTSVRAGAKVLRDLGFVSEFRWATTVEEVALALVSVGPVVLGTRWDESMFEPDDSGFVHPDGKGVGGHAYLAIGVNRALGQVRCLNSWGPGWGAAGRFWLSYPDLDELLADQGEACLAIEARP
jgi:C1A family cysteine protease